MTVHPLLWTSSNWVQYHFFWLIAWTFFLVSGIYLAFCCQFNLLYIVFYCRITSATFYSSQIFIHCDLYHYHVLSWGMSLVTSFHSPEMPLSCLFIYSHCIYILVHSSKFISSTRFPQSHQISLNSLLSGHCAFHAVFHKYYT